jgi:PAS domain S-box-containing protein
MLGTLIRWRGYPDNDPTGTFVHDISKYPDKQYILQHNSHFIINDTREYEAWANIPGMEWIRSSLAVPITLDDGVIGFLNVESDVPYNFTVQHAEWLTAFANQAALALRNARLMEQIRDYASDLEKVVQSRTAQLRAVLGSIRDGLVYHNLKNEPQYLNRTLVEMLGYPYEDWMFRNPSFADLVDADKEVIDRMVLRWTRQMELQGFMQDEVVLKRRDETTFPAMIMRVTVKDEEGESIGTLMLVRDISQAKQLEEQRERFIANASHELRTPIANMKTRLYLMRRKPESIAENLEIIVNVTNWMQRLVDDMFDLSRFQRGILELHREQADVRDLLREIMVFQQLEAERKEITLMMNVPTDPLIALIDPYRLMQVFSNLVSNAINYTPLGGRVGVEVTVESGKHGDEMVIMVADTGQGIPPEHLENLFKPFFRASGQSRGAGLGLSIAREIIGLHGGTIGVDSEVGQGSRFTIRIPIIREGNATPVLAD